MKKIFTNEKLGCVTGTSIKTNTCTRNTGKVKGCERERLKWLNMNLNVNFMARSRKSKFVQITSNIHIKMVKIDLEFGENINIIL